MRDSYVLYLLRPGHKEFVRTAVGAFSEAVEYEETGTKEGDQILFKKKGGKGEYVLDSAGQHVARILIRNITKANRKTIKRGEGISASDPKAKVKVWQHVVGAKKSQYISSTKQETGDITNPHESQLGGHGKARIDLLYVSPKVIFDLTTKKGQDRWELSSPDRKVTRQALEDVIRTQEVLVKGEIPDRAVTLLDDE